MGLDRGIEEDSNPRRKFFIPFPENVSQGNFGKDLQGKPFVSVKDLTSSQLSSRPQESFRILSIKSFQVINV
jgi:hypothetical protein